jgi:hypothetical protein
MIKTKPGEHLESNIAHVGVNLDSPSLPSGSKLRRLYQDRVESVKKRWSIVDVPYTSRSLREIFRLAARHQRPFKDEGRGFQDAVIYLSVIDDLATNPSRNPAILVASDGDYDSIDIRTFVTDLNDIDLKIARLDATTETLKSHLKESELRDWEDMQNRAKDKLYEIRHELESFLGSTIVPERLDSIRRVLEVYQITLVEIGNVRTPNPRDLKAGQEFDISADLKINVSAAIAPWPGISYELTEQAFYIGSPRHLNTPAINAASLERFDVHLELQARAVLRGREFDKIIPISAKILPMYLLSPESPSSRSVFSTFTLPVSLSQGNKR